MAKYISVIYWHKKNSDGWVVDLCDSESSETLQSFEGPNAERDARAFAQEYAEKNGLEIKV
jgi:hypothetical protein